MINRVTLLGRLGRDPELRYTGSQQAVCNLSVATDRAWTTKDGERKKETEWHRVQVWGASAEACEKYLAKGRRVYVEGRISTREYEDKNGEKKRSTEIVAELVKFLDYGDEGELREERHAPAPQKRSEEKHGPDFGDDDSIPFAPVTL